MHGLHRLHKVWVMVLVLCSIGGMAAAQNAKPNILVIMSDDVGTGVCGRGYYRPLSRSRRPQLSESSDNPGAESGIGAVFRQQYHFKRLLFGNNQCKGNIWWDATLQASRCLIGRRCCRLPEPLRI